MSASAEAFVGRTHELERLHDVRRVVESGRPQTILLTGPAGIGKSSLLDRFLAQASGIRLIRASGEEWEALVAYGVLDQILRMAGVRSGYRPAGRDREGPPDDPLHAGTLLLETLEDLGRDATVVLVVDDVQWADADSLRALVFALRRLAHERVMTVFVARDEDIGDLPGGLVRLAGGSTGLPIALKALDTRSIGELAAALGLPRLSATTVQRLHEHTRGNPLYINALLTELPSDRWQIWQPVLPAPRTYAERIMKHLAATGPRTQALVQACAVLGVRSSLRTAATMVDLADPIAAFEEAAGAGLLRAADDLDIWQVTFQHPLIQAAVYENIKPAKRMGLHRLAAPLLDDAGSALRHLVAAASSPDPDLADRLDAFARHEMRWGAWASAGSALIQASRLSGERTLREERLLRAVDAIVSAGDLPRASMLSEEIALVGPGPLREAALGYLAILHGRVGEAQARLTDGWRLAESSGDPHLQALLALRWTLHSVGRLRGADVVTWSRRSIDLVPGDDAVRLEAQALHGLGLGLMGRVPEGLAAYAAVLGSVTGDDGSIVGRLTMARSWLQIAVDDLDDVPEQLAAVAPAQLRSGSIRIAVWSYVWLSRAHFLRGEWDDAMAASNRAVSVLQETGHEWLRPLARWVAAGVCANRGDRSAAQEHVARGAADDTDCELMTVAAALAAAETAWAHGDHHAVLAALEPVRSAPPPREGLDEPGLWPWPHLYADALVGAGRLDEAESFLDHHQGAARRLRRRSAAARLGRVRGRLLAAQGRPDEADGEFRAAFDQLVDLTLPFDRALIELAHGQLLRRRGRRREAYRLLHAARDRFTELGARPHLDRCTRELEGSGLSYSSRDDFDPARLTRQELAIARLAATGLRTREIAAEMSISVKTVQFHLGNIYPKLGVHSRVELAQWFTDPGSEAKS